VTLMFRTGAGTHTFAKGANVWGTRPRISSLARGISGSAMWHD